MRHFFCLLFCSRNGCLTGQHYAGRTLGTVFPPLLSSHQVSPCGNGVGGMFLRPRAFTTMNIEFNGANPCTPKNLAKQLIVESAKILNHQHRQALVDIFKTLDQAEKSTLDNLESLQKSEPKRKNILRILFIKMSTLKMNSIKSIGVVSIMIHIIKNILKIG